MWRVVIEKGVLKVGYQLEWYSLNTTRGYDFKVDAQFGILISRIYRISDKNSEGDYTIFFSQLTVIMLTRHDQSVKDPSPQTRPHWPPFYGHRMPCKNLPASAVDIRLRQFFVCLLKLGLFQLAKPSDRIRTNHSVALLDILSDTKNRKKQTWKKYTWKKMIQWCVPSQLHGAHTHLQPFRRIEHNIHIAIYVLPGTHFHLSQVKHLRVMCLF